MEMDKLIAIADQFVIQGQDRQGQVRTVTPFGSGNINDTYRVELDSRDNSPPSCFVLQRINTQVFRQPAQVMQNIHRCTRHMGDRLLNCPLDHRWEIPQVLLTSSGQTHWYHPDESCWRGMSFIPDADSFDVISDQSQAKQVGQALGLFHSLISDLSAAEFADTLPGFHITPLYLQYFQQVLSQAAPQPSPEINYCLQMIRDRQGWASVLETAKGSGKLPIRLIHGDPKINNILFDRQTGQAVSVIDLDTVKPGLVHYDIGDCLRSGCNLAGEETPDWESVDFQPDLCHAILQGYLGIGQAFLTEPDYAYLFDALRLIAFELGLRFFTDYLAGNVYFKVKHPDHNLARALVQFKLTERIEAQESLIRTMILDWQ
jgi:Ser/Thr protein kinase RdoA (MazF antagonist)